MFSRGATCGMSRMSFVTSTARYISKDLKNRSLVGTRETCWGATGTTLAGGLKPRAIAAEKPDTHARLNGSAATQP